jgi:hypothetical protein
MFDWQYDLHAPTLMGLCVLLFVGFEWVGLILIRPFLYFLVRGQRNLNEMVGYILSFYAVFYGLLLGLLVVAGYQSYVEVQTDVVQEATAIASLFRVSQVLPTPVNQEIKASLVKYTQIAITEEWPQQQAGITPNSQNPMVTALQQALFSVEPATKREEIALDHAVQTFYQLFEARRIRLNAATTHLPGILWYVVLMGGFLTLMLVWLFDARVTLHFVLGGLLALFIATMIAVLVALDNPFSGDIGVTPEPFVVVQQYMTADGK